MAVAPDAVDRIFATWDHPASPGCAVAVIRDGATVFQRAFGLANLEYNLPITPATVFHVASITKQFTAAAVVLLALDGRLDLDDGIRKHLPEAPDFGTPITVRHLMYHTSGLRDQWELVVHAGWRMDDIITTNDVLELVSAQRDLNFPPGANFTYCNTGYTLLAVAVERITGQSFRHFCAEHIFAPLGMAASHMHDDYTELVPNRAESYRRRQPDGWQRAVLSYATVGATSLFTTVDDLGRWDANFTHGRVGGPALKAILETPGRLADGTPIAYAGGLLVSHYRDRPVIEHSGGDAGFRSHLLRLPDQQLSVIILGNAADLRPSLLARQVADLFLNGQVVDRAAHRAPSTDYSPSDDELQGYAGLYHHHADGAARRFVVSDGRLILQMWGSQELEPVERGLFRVASAPTMQYRFETAPSGIRQVIETAGSTRPVAYAAIKPACPTAVELDAYAGDYRSSELDARYTVARQAERLVLMRRKYGAVHLTPTVVDGFVAEEADPSPYAITFERDRHGTVVGFRLTSGRNRNLVFVRSDASP